MPHPKTPAIKIAELADCDPEVVRRLYKGLPIRPRLAARIAKAMQVLGLPWPEPSPRTR